MKWKIITMTHNTLMTLSAMLRDRFGKQNWNWKEVVKTLIIELVIIFVFAFEIFISRWIIGDVILIFSAVIFPLVLMGLVTCDGLDVDDNIILVTLKFFIFVVDVSLLIILSFAICYKQWNGAIDLSKIIDLLYDSAQYFFNTGAVGSAVENKDKLSHIIESLIGYSLTPIIITVFFYKITTCTKNKRKRARKFHPPTKITRAS